MMTSTASTNWIVITTINPPTAAVALISDLCLKGVWRAVVVGDNKTTADWSAPGIDYLSVESQKQQFGALAESLPYNHYCRKNLGYLYAISKGATCVLETDDDNFPYPEFGSNISESATVASLGGAKWINVYSHFTDSHIWPRGLPLDRIQSKGLLNTTSTTKSFPIQQYLADLDPDVDAIYRLAIDKTVTFGRNPSVSLSKGSWVPFNSQNTVFFSDAFALLYLPCHVSFRMTDIWRSFVAQQALWVVGREVLFHASTVKQIRNQHNLMRDFEDEIPGYLHNDSIADILSRRSESLHAGLGLPTIALSLWESLHEGGIIPDVEMPIITAWMQQLQAINEAKKASAA